MNRSVFVFSGLLLVAGCGGAPQEASVEAALNAAQQNPVDLTIYNARVFDNDNLSVSERTSVLIRNGVIVASMPDAAAKGVRSLQSVDAGGRLLTPGFLDVHSHTADVLGDSISPGGGGLMRLVPEPDSVARYRRTLAESYLPYGVTAFRELGADDTQWPVLMQLMMPQECMPAYYPAGGALITRDPEHDAYPGHRALRDSIEAEATVREYHARGIRHVKLYWRLAAPEFRAALSEARRLNMNVTAHLDRTFGEVSIHAALDHDVRHFEHAYTLGVEVLAPEEMRAGWASARALLEPSTNALFHMGILEQMRALPQDDPRIQRLIARLASVHGTVTPTLHIFAQRIGLTFFASEPAAAFEDSSNWDSVQVARAREGYARLAELVLQLHRSGVRLATGSDSRDPGRAIISEMLLLHDAGLSMPEVLQAATLHSATAAGVGDRHGKIQAGRVADLVLFDEDPIVEPRALVGPKRVWRAGVEWQQCEQGAR